MQAVNCNYQLELSFQELLIYVPVPLDILANYNIIALVIKANEDKNKHKI